MKVLCINYEYPPIGGGGGPACQGLCEAVVAQGHHVDVVTSAMADLPRSEVRRGVHIHRTACRRRHRHYTTTLEMLSGIRPAIHKALELCRVHQYDLIHCHFALPSGLVARHVARRMNLPWVLTVHGSDVPGYNPDRFNMLHRLIRPVWRRVMRDTNLTITPSHFLGELIRKHVEVPIEVIPHGFDPPAYPAIERRKRILVATRMFKRKGVQYFLRAMQGIEHDWEILIAGDGPYLPRLRALAEELGVSARFLGMVKREELASLYRSSSIFVFPSSRENFPVVLLEAMAAGCAVVTSTASGCSEVVGDAAIRVEAEAVEPLREALGQLLRDEARVTQLGRLAEDRIREFTWTRVVQQYLGAYERAMASHPAAGGPGSG